MSSNDMRLELERFQLQLHDARTRIADLELVVDRLTTRVGILEQDNMQTVPFHEVPIADCDAIEVEVDE